MTEKTVNIYKITKLLGCEGDTSISCYKRREIVFAGVQKKLKVQVYGGYDKHSS